MPHLGYRCRITAYPTVPMGLSPKCIHSYRAGDTWVCSSWLCWSSRNLSLRCCSYLCYNEVTEPECFQVRPVCLGKVSTPLISYSVVIYLTAVLLSSRMVRLMMFARLRWRHPFSPMLFSPKWIQSYTAIFPGEPSLLFFSHLTRSLCWLSGVGNHWYFSYLNRWLIAYVVVVNRLLISLYLEESFVYYFLDCSWFINPYSLHYIIGDCCNDRCA